jgi:hypothetical protein
MSVQVSYKKQTIFGILLLLIMLIIVEIFLQIFPSNYECEFSNHEIFDKYSQIEKDNMCKEYSNVSYNYDTPIKRLNPQNGEYVNINSDGFRGDFINFQDQSYKIFVLGGSTVFGHVTSSDDKTIPAILETKFHDKEISVQIINAGIPYATTIDERYYVEQNIVNYQPNLVIMYDGWNDIWHIEETKANIPYEIFSSNNALENNLLFVQSLEFKISRGLFYFFDQINYKTGLGVNQFLYDVFAKINSFQANSTQGENLEISDKKLYQLENNIINNWSEVCDLGIINKFHTVNIIQPIFQTSTEHYDNTSSIESQYLKKLDIERIQMESSCENIIDLRDTFSEFDESKIFFDAGHMSDKGNEIISKKIFEISLPIVENTS